MENDLQNSEALNLESHTQQREYTCGKAKFKQRCAGNQLKISDSKCPILSFGSFLDILGKMTKVYFSK